MAVSIFILGGGGHTKVLLDALCHHSSVTILGILDKDARLHGQSIYGIPIIGCEDDILKQYESSTIKLVNGIGSVGLPHARAAIFQRFKMAGYDFIPVIHSSAYVAHDVVVGEGSQLMAGCVVQPGSRIGNNVIVNTNASIDHDCLISDHVHLAPGVICCGNVAIGEGTHIGCGAVIKQGVKIANHCLIAAGAIVIHDVVPGTTVAGMPAKVMA